MVRFSQFIDEVSRERLSSYVSGVDSKRGTLGGEMSFHRMTRRLQSRSHALLKMGREVIHPGLQPVRVRAS